MSIKRKSKIIQDPSLSISKYNAVNRHFAFVQMILMRNSTAAVYRPEFGKFSVFQKRRIIR